jgi:hypothetical protein
MTNEEARMTNQTQMTNDQGHAARAAAHLRGRAGRRSTRLFVIAFSSLFCHSGFFIHHFAQAPFSSETYLHTTVTE